MCSRLVDLKQNSSTQVNLKLKMFYSFHNDARGKVLASVVLHYAANMRSRLHFKALKLLSLGV